MVAPVQIVAADLAERGMSLQFSDGSTIGPFMCPRIEFSAADWAFLAEALGEPIADAALRVEGHSFRLAPRRRPLHRALTSPRQWTMRRLYRGRR